MAGPVVAAAVILKRQRKSRWLQSVNDSKILSPTQREKLYLEITGKALSLGVGIVSHHYIDTHGIVPATRLAMKQAVMELSPKPEALLIDYLSLPEVPLPQQGIVNGDAACVSIACASVIAKVVRDRLMVDLDARFPGYWISRHKGYGTVKHLECLRKLGPCDIHRLSFAPVRNTRSLL